jgi:hypothetical protein
MIGIFLIGLGTAVATQLLKYWDTVEDFNKWVKRGIVFLLAYAAVLVKNWIGVDVPESVLTYLVAAIWPAVIAAFNAFGLYEWFKPKTTTTTTSAATAKAAKL